MTVRRDRIGGGGWVLGGRSLVLIVLIVLKFAGSTNVEQRAIFGQKMALFWILVICAEFVAQILCQRNPNTFWDKSENFASRNKIIPDCCKIWLVKYPRAGAWRNMVLCSTCTVRVLFLAKLWIGHFFEKCAIGIIAEHSTEKWFKMMNFCRKFGFGWFL